MPLTITYQGTETSIDDDATALVGSDPEATIRIVRPGISRKHAIISHDGAGWKVQDAGSRNGTFAEGERVQVRSFDAPLSLCLGHPSDGEIIELIPVGTETATVVDEVFSLDEPPTSKPAPAASASVAAMASEPTRVHKAAPSTSSDVELAQLTAAIRDQISAIKGLTWSVWAMIAVTAALIVLTLFVGILSN
ncbi:MAG: FHA domain-containing protein [Acidimicrobiia bacterium]